MGKLLKIWVYSNLHISGIAFLMSYEINVILGINDNWQSPLMVFFGTLFIYNLGFYRNVLFHDKSQRGHAAWMEKNRRYWIFSLLLSLFFMIYLFSSYSIESKVFISVLSIVSFLYINHNIDLFGINMSIRNIAYLKTIIVSLIWTMMTIFPQMIEVETIGLNSEVIKLFSWRFFFILPITLMFDIRDIYSDPEKLKTLPRLIGIFNSKVLAYFSLSAAYIIFLSLGFSKLLNLTLSIVYILMALSIYKSKVNRKELFYAGWFDGLMALHSLIVITIF